MCPTQVKWGVLTNMLKRSKILVLKLARENKYMVYLTKRAGKYKILSRVRVKNYFPERPKRSKIPSRAAAGRKGRYFHDLEGLKGK